MTARIDIKHPSGRSLEGFPEMTDKPLLAHDWVNNEVWNHTTNKWIKLFKGDIITIEIL